MRPKPKRRFRDSKMMGFRFDGFHGFACWMLGKSYVMSIFSQMAGEFQGDESHSK